MLNLWNLRQLIGLMVYRDLLGRYKGSIMGAFWPVINPLGHLLLYTFIFNCILQVKFGNNPSTSNFALYLMAGLIPWGGFSEAIARAPTIILEVPNLVKKVVFPLEILPLVLTISSLLSQGIAITLLILAELLYAHSIHRSLIFLPLIIASQLLLTSGLSWFLASLGVYIRDLRHAMALSLSAWMYATPIVYPATKFPPNLSFLVWINPLAGIVGDYRRVLLEGRQPDWPLFAVYTSMGLLAYILGYLFFCKTKRSFADVI